MRLSKKAKWIFGGLALVYLFCFIGLNHNIDPARGGKPILYSDGIGHYDYLPRIFFEHHLQYTANDRAFASADAQGHYVNRFYVGTALLQTPFFLAGALYAKMGGYALDGYSPPFQYAIGIGSVFYALYGLYFLLVILVRVLKINETNALWTIVLVALGSNLLFYTVWFGTFSHVYSFFAVIFLMYRWCLLIEKNSNRHLFLFALVLGLVFIIRPVNVLVIFILPAFFRDKKSFVAFGVQLFRPRFLFILLVGLLLPFIIQSCAWYLQTGHALEWSYRQEGFKFLHPQIGPVLVGFRRGLFVYAPLLLLCLCGMVAGYKHYRWTTVWLTIFLLVFTYVTASWWHWTYGDTFGIRPYNDVLLVFAVFLAFVLQHAARAKKIILSMGILLTCLQLVFAWQFAAGITNISTMTADKFFHLFLRTSPAYEQWYGGSNDIPPYAPKGMTTICSYQNNFDQQPGGVLQVKGDEFVASTECIFPLTEKNTRHTWIDIRFKRKILTPAAMKNVVFVFHALDPRSGTTRTYKTTRVKEYPIEQVNEWATIHHRVWLPDAVDAGNLVKAYIWNQGHEEFYLDDYNINIQVPRW